MGNDAENTDPVLNRGLQARDGEAGVKAKLTAQPRVFELSVFEDSPPHPRPQSPKGARGEKKILRWLRIDLVSRLGAPRDQFFC